MVNNLDPAGIVDFSGFNATGSTIPALSAVRISGASSEFPKIELAIADNVDNMPAAGITTAEIESGFTGTVRVQGIIDEIDSSAFSANDPLYVSGTVAGELVVSINPPDYITQRVGVVVVSDAAEGSIYVFIDPQMDGHILYTARDHFIVRNPSGAESYIDLSASGGSIVVSATPTGSRTLTLPDATDTLVGKATTDTLTNKTIGVSQLVAGTAGYSLKSTSAATPATAWEADGLMFFREWQFVVDPGAATGTRVGLLTAPTLSGAGGISNTDSATRALIRHITGASSGNSGGVISGFDVLLSGWNPKTAFVYNTGTDISSSRWWCGLTSATLVAVATPTTQHVAAFSYDTGRDGTVFWRTVTNDGVGAATVTATSVAVATSTTYRFRIEINGATNVLFYIDDVLVNTHTTTLPSTTQVLGFQMTVTTLTTAARRMFWSRVGGSMV